MRNHTKEDIINSACDLFGYSVDDFDGMSYKRIIFYLSNEQLEEIREYLQ